MICQGFPLDDFVDGLLDAESQATVVAHLRECPACATLVETLDETRDLLRQAQPIVASPQFERRLETRLRWENLGRDGLKLLALGLAAVAALLRLLLARRGSGGTSAASALQEAPEEVL
ncbi:MAG: zf-HC2 domain-containing protein [Chloroflexi bacterium]|nr:zf-HC2 domain-containing protein [Chloroflexota bacterium]